MIKPLQFLVDELTGMFIGPYEITRLREMRRVYEEFDKQVNISLLTAQEYLLSGLFYVTGRLPQEKYLSNPHAPIAVIDGIMTIEECDRRRQSIGRFPTGMPNYWGKAGGNYASLELLDLNPKSLTYGKTLRDSQLVGENLPDNYESLPNLVHQFPFKRSEQLRFAF